MIIKSLGELQEADDRTLHFNPVGLGGRMRPEDAAEFQQHVVARHDLVQEAADGTRQSYEQLRTIYSYGVLCYDIFTIVSDHALLVFEQALRDRFIAYYHGSVTFVNPSSGSEQIAADRYEQVYEYASRHRNWKLRVGDGPETIAFNGMLFGLRHWARKVGLLRGQRNRGIERAISNLRDLVAHPTSYHLTTPVDAATTISDLAEIINYLWGSPTPGGRLYPAPVRRTTVALMWNTQRGEVRSAVVEEAASGHGGEPGDVEAEPDGWTYVLVRGVPHDWDLLHFDAKFETARYPSEWLWGPGSATDATAWLAGNQPPDDEVDILDRIFLVRYHSDLLDLPRSPDIAAGVTDDEKPGTWYLIRADSPTDAFSHLRQDLAGGHPPANTDGRCSVCPVEVVGSGTWQHAMDLLTAVGVTVRARAAPDLRVPSRMGWPRGNEIVGNGAWTIPHDEL